MGKKNNCVQPLSFIGACKPFWRRLYPRSKICYFKILGTRITDLPAIASRKGFAEIAPMAELKQSYINCLHPTLVPVVELNGGPLFITFQYVYFCSFM